MIEIGTCPSSTRESVKRDELIRRIRARVLDGTYPPGARLPVRLELLEALETTPITLQRAMQMLFDEGVLVSGGRRGTFVAEKPPHLARYALILNDAPDQKSNNFARSLARAAELVAARRGVEIVPCHVPDISQSRRELENLHYQVQNHLFAGIIFSNNPFKHLETPLLDTPDVPRVMFINADSRQFPEIMRVGNDFSDLLNRSLSHIATLKPRELVVMLPLAKLMDALPGLLAEHGLNCRPEHQLFLSNSHADVTPQIVRLLWSKDRAIQPDTLFIGDDNILARVTETLVAHLGPEHARQIKIVSHMNFPLLRNYPIPIRMFGYNLEWFVEHALDLVDAERTCGVRGPMALLPIMEHITP